VKARQRRHVHLGFLLAWAIPGGLLSWLLKNSVPWVVFMSWYAIVVSHAAAWSAETPVEAE
jgi:hypothetical protein